MRRPTALPGARAIAMMIAATALLAACRAGTAARQTAATSPPSQAPTSSPASPSQVRPLGTRVWLGGLRVASDPRDLSADTQLLLSRVDGATVVTPAMCYEGLPAGIAASNYVMGVEAGTHAELEQFVAKSGFEAIFEVKVRVLCTD